MIFLPYRDELPSKHTPVLTISLIVINSYLLLSSIINASGSEWAAHFGFSAGSMIDRPYTVITSTFLHAGILHLLLNMWFLWLFGDNVESKFGRFRFLMLYLLAGIIGNIVHVGFTGFGKDFPTIGASGSVAGVMGAYFVMFPSAKVRCVFLLVFYPIRLRISAYWLLGMWLAVEFVSALSAASDSRIAHWAHIGGFITGLIWAWRHPRFNPGLRRGVF